MYDINGFRDDLGDILLVKKYSDATDKQQNYLVFYDRKPELILRVYKTDKAYGEVRFPMPKIILDYLKHWNKKMGDLIISKNDGKMYGKNGALSSFISKMLKDAGVDTGGEAINLLRHAFITRELQKHHTIADRDKLAKN